MRFVETPPNDEIVHRIKNEKNVEINSDKEVTKLYSEDSILELTAQRVIEAYNMGFDSDKSMELFDEKNELRVINLKELCRNRTRIREQKGRIIGEDGRTKELIEELTGTNLVISDKKIGIIGNVLDVMFSLDIIDDIVSGIPHSRVYKKMEQYNSVEK